MTSSSYHFGLHLGNTNACIAINRGDGHSEVVANPSGDRVTPAAVGFRTGGEVLTGLSARQLSVRYPGAVVRAGNRRVLLENGYSSSDGPELVREEDRAFYRVDPAGDDDDNKKKSLKVTPEEVQTHVLKYMHDIAVSQLSPLDEDEDLPNEDNSAELPCVLTVPASFGKEQRSKAAECAKKAGFRVAQVISEPAAALLAHGVGQMEGGADDDGADVDEDSPLICVVYRAGGESVSCSVAEVRGGMIRLLETRESSSSKEGEKVGGVEVTRLLGEFLAEEFKRKYKLDPRSCGRRPREKLLICAESAKRGLTTLETASAHAESLAEGIDLQAQVTRARFDNEVVGKVLSAFLSPLRSALSSTSVSPESVSKLVLCGGAARTPKIKKAVADMFPKAQVLCGPSPEETLAAGAAKQAANVAASAYYSNKANVESLNHNVELKATSGKVTVSVGGGEATTLISSGCAIPVRRSKHLDKLEDPSAALEAEFFFEREGSKTLLARLSLPALPSPPPPHPPRVSASAHIHRDGSLHLAIADRANVETRKGEQKTIAAPAKKSEE